MATAAALSFFDLFMLIRDTTSSKGAERMLLIVLASRCQANRGYCAWPSYSQLAEDCQLDDMTLRRAAKRLADKGLISVKRRDYRSNVFYLNIPLIRKQAAEAKAERQVRLLNDDLGISPFPDVQTGTPDDGADLSHAEEVEPDYAAIRAMYGDPGDPNEELL